MILAGGIARGLNMSDTRDFTLGGWVDFCIEYNNWLTDGDGGTQGGESDSVRMATQADIDRFTYG